MKRIGINELFMKMAIDVAKRSTCARVQVGAVIVKNQRVISMGWNGVPKGQKHCSDIFRTMFDNESKNKILPGTDIDKVFDKWMNSPKMKEKHHEFAVRYEVHSEMNAMIFAAKNGIATDGSDIYIVWSPCIDCAKALLQSGIKKVFYNKKYERDTRGIEFLEENGITCKQVKVNS